ncbi:MAG: hypothetical protein LBF78_02340 [Treponema sp.]|jgi:hypothetical protein|nr:hypothetical protein [Treponema sp.]
MTYTIDVLESGAINLLKDMEKLKLIRLIPSSKRKTVQSGPQTPGGDFSDDPADAFGIWKDRNISLESIREKAWKRR